MPFLNGEQIMRSSCPFEKSRRKSIALTGTPRLKRPWHLTIYNTPINKEMEVKPAHTAIRCYSGYPLGGSVCSPFSGDVPGEHPSITLLSPYLALPQANPPA